MVTRSLEIARMLSVFTGPMIGSAAVTIKWLAYSCCSAKAISMLPCPRER